MLFKIPKPGEIDSSEQSNTCLMLKSIYNLIAVLNVTLLLFVAPLLIERLLKLKPLEITNNNITSLIIAIYITTTIAISIFYMFHESYIPSIKTIYFHIISFNINAMLVLLDLIFFNT